MHFLFLRPAALLALLLGLQPADCSTNAVVTFNRREPQEFREIDAWPAQEDRFSKMLDASQASEHPLTLEQSAPLAAEAERLIVHKIAEMLDSPRPDIAYSDAFRRELQTILASGNQEQRQALLNWLKNPAEPDRLLLFSKAKDFEGLRRYAILAQIVRPLSAADAYASASDLRADQFCLMQLAQLQHLQGRDDIARANLLRVQMLAKDNPGISATAGLQLADIYKRAGMYAEQNAALEKARQTFASISDAKGEASAILAILDPRSIKGVEPVPGRPDLPPMAFGQTVDEDYLRDLHRAAALADQTREPMLQMQAYWLLYTNSSKEASFGKTVAELMAAPPTANTEYLFKAIEAASSTYEYYKAEEFADGALNALLAAKDWHAAKRLSAVYLNVAREMRDKTRILSLRFLEADIAEAQGDFKGAAAILEESNRVVFLPRMKANIEERLGALSLHQGDSAQACEHYQNAYRIDSAYKNDNGMRFVEGVARKSGCTLHP